MRFMMLMIPKGYEDAAPGTMPAAEAVAAMTKYNNELKKAGVSDKIIEVATSYNNYWTVSAEINAAAFPVMDELGINSNGPDDTYGNFDEARVQALFDELVPIMEAAGLQLPEGYTAESAYTNEFIDPSIGR